MGNLCLCLQGAGACLKRLFIFHLWDGKRGAAGGRVPAELPTGDVAPGATVSHFCLRLPHSHSLSISCLSDLHSRAAAPPSPQEEWKRGGGEAGRIAVGCREGKRGTPDSICRLCLPRSQTRIVALSSRLQRPTQLHALFFFFLFRVIWLLPPPVSLLHVGSTYVSSQPSSLTAFPPHSGVIKNKGHVSPAPSTPTHHPLWCFLFIAASRSFA